MRKLSEKSLTPLYQQVMDDVLAKIESGEYESGSKIPSEGELSEQYSVSRITVRRAIEELSRDGYLTKKQGKGTFVNPPKLTRKIRRSINASNYNDACLASGREPERRTLSVTCEQGSSTICELLGIPKGSDVIAVTRLDLADHTPVIIERHYLSHDVFPFLFESNLEEDSIVTAIEKVTGKRADTVMKRTIELARANDWAASNLRVSVGEPLFLETIVVSSEDTPAMVSKLYSVGTYFSFEV